MCLIAIKSRGAHLGEDEIRHDFKTNPHGAGFMYADPADHLVHWEKGFFTVEDLIKRWNAVVKDNMVAALHTRIATHGAHSSDLCHPFPLDGSDLFRSVGSAPLVMMHNGIVPEKNWKKFEQKGDSDTSAFARRLTPILNNELPDDGVSAMIDVYGGGSRFVFLNGEGEFVTIGKWHKENGILFSNNHFHGRMTETEWREYGRQRGFTFFSSNSNYSNYAPSKTQSYSWYGSPVKSEELSRKNEPYLFSKEEIVEEEEVDVKDYGDVDIFEKADQMGFYPISSDDDDENGELRGSWDETVQYFIIDSYGYGDTYNGNDDDICVYEYDALHDTFVLAKDVWYHFFTNPDDIDESSYLTAINK